MAFREEKGEKTNTVKDESGGGDRYSPKWKKEGFGLELVVLASHLVIPHKGAL